MELSPFDAAPCPWLSSLVVIDDRSKRKISRIPLVEEVPEVIRLPELESNATNLPSPETDGFALDVVVELPLLWPLPPQLGTMSAAASKSSP